MIERKLKSGLAFVLRSCGLAEFLRRRIGGMGVFLSLHEIHHDVDSELKTGCSVAFLGDVVKELRRDGWEFVSIDDALQRITHQATGDPFVVLTFDDGYRDALTRTLPILERQRVPFTIYVPTEALTRQLYAWWLGLRELFRSHDKVNVECMNRRFSCGDLAGKIFALGEATRWMRRDYSRKLDLEPTFASYGISLAAVADAYFLNPDELRALASSPLVTIGAHTTSHAALSSLGLDQVRNEMADNRRYLERLLNQDIRHFAYPYGDSLACGEREATIAHELGFSSAVTIEASPVLREHRYRPHFLPRIGVRPHETLGTLYYRASGLSWAINLHQSRYR